MKLASVELKQTPIIDPDVPWSDVEKAELNEACITEKAFDEKGEIYWWRQVVVDLDLIPHRFGYEVKKMIRPKSKLADDLEDFAPRATTVVNNKVNVAVPGFGLLMLNDVKVECDLCTEGLLDELKKGWRIVAVCPQPDQRRPDYVLGRVKQPNEDD